MGKKEEDTRGVRAREAPRGWSEASARQNARRTSCNVNALFGSGEAAPFLGVPPLGPPLGVSPLVPPLSAPFGTATADSAGTTLIAGLLSRRSKRTSREQLLRPAPPFASSLLCDLIEHRTQIVLAPLQKGGHAASHLARRQARIARRTAGRANRASAGAAEARQAEAAKDLVDALRLDRGGAGVPLRGRAIPPRARAGSCGTASSAARGGKWIISTRGRRATIIASPTCAAYAIRATLESRGSSACARSKYGSKRTTQLLKKRHIKRSFSLLIVPLSWVPFSILKTCTPYPGQTSRPLVLGPLVHS